MPSDDTPDEPSETPEARRLRKTREYARAQTERRKNDPTYKARKAAYMREYLRRPEPAQKQSARKKLYRSIPEVRAAETEYLRQYRADHGRDVTKEAAQARARRKAKNPALKQRQYTKLGIDWNDPEQVREYHRRKNAEWLEKNPDAKERQKAKRQTPEKRAAHREAVKRSRERQRLLNPPKQRQAHEYKTVAQERARASVKYAIKKGELPVGKCALRHLGPCRGRIEGHHWRGYDPAHWLDLQWLCKRHHTHAEFNVAEAEAQYLPFELDPEFVPTQFYSWDAHVPGVGKECSRCHLVKPLEEFYRDPRKADGLYAKCKPCHNAVTIASNQKRRGL